MSFLIEIKDDNALKYYETFPYSFLILKKLGQTIYVLNGCVAYVDIISVPVYNCFSTFLTDIIKAFNIKRPLVVDDLFYLVRDVNVERVNLTNKFLYTLESVESKNIPTIPKEIPDTADFPLKEHDLICFCPPVTAFHELRLSQVNLDVINAIDDKIFILPGATIGVAKNFINFFNYFVENKIVYHVHIPSPIIDNCWFVVLPYHIGKKYESNFTLTYPFYVSKILERKGRGVSGIYIDFDLSAEKMLYQNTVGLT